MCTLSGEGRQSHLILPLKMSASHITLLSFIEYDLFDLARESTDKYWQAFTNAEYRYTMSLPEGYHPVIAVRWSDDLSTVEVDSKELESIIASDGLDAGYAYVVERALPTLLAQIPSGLEEAEKHKRNFAGVSILSSILRYLRYSLVPRWEYLPQKLRDLYIYLLFVAVSNVEPPAFTYDEDWYDKPPEEVTLKYQEELEKFEILKEQIIDILTDLDSSGIISLEEEEALVFTTSRDLNTLIQRYLPGRRYYTTMDREGIIDLLRRKE
jgi:hypothetical protein